MFTVLSGELTVYCQGPTQRALCELEDNDDGTFTLQVDPQEAGAHLLNILYDRQHVPGMYNLMLCQSIHI